jgi:phosphatidylglycerol:prolipoprotein diacylglycerol transferase
VTVARLGYTFFMLLALGVFLLAQRLLPRPPGVAALPRRQRTALGLAAFVGGVLGAKLPFALGYQGGPLTWGAWLSDGKTVVAGLIGAYVTVELAKLAMGIRVKTGDAFAVPLALAMAVGRWGCFCNGCCYGRPSGLPWAVPFYQPDGTLVPCHPTQAYESIFHLSMAGVLTWMTFRDLLPRQRLKFYLISYGVYRFLTEYIRPEPEWWLGLTFYQWASLLLVAGLAVQWWFDRRPAGGPQAPLPCPAQ